MRQYESSCGHVFYLFIFLLYPFSFVIFIYFFFYDGAVKGAMDGGVSEGEISCCRMLPRLVTTNNIKVSLAPFSRVFGKETMELLES